MSNIHSDTEIVIKEKENKPKRGRPRKTAQENTTKPDDEELLYNLLKEYIKFLDYEQFKHNKPYVLDLVEKLK